MTSDFYSDVCRRGSPEISSKRGNSLVARVGLALIAISILPLVPQGGAQVLPPPGAELLADTNRLTPSDPSPVLPVEQGHLFTAFDGETRKLWVTDLSGNVTETLTREQLASEPTILGRFLGQVFLSADDGEHGRELWTTDGTHDGTRLLRDIRPGPESSVSLSPFEQGGLLYFGANDGEHGRELWTTDGTHDGTRLLRDIRPGPEGSAIRRVVGDGWSHQSVVYFTADDGKHGREVWSTDGTAEGTRLAVELVPGPEGLPTYSRVNAIPLGEAIVFTHQDDDHGRELWIADAGFERPRILRDLLPGPQGSSPRELSRLGERILFFAADDELWLTDGSSGGTRRLADFVEGSSLAGQRPFGLTRFGECLLFNACDIEHGQQLWVTDGTTEGTRRFTDIEGWRPSGRFLAVEAAERVFLAASDFEHGSELWVTDGSSDGTRLLLDIWPGPAGSRPEDFVVGRGRIFFSAENELGRELWTSDGTSEGTRLVRDIQTEVTEDARAVNEIVALPMRVAGEQAWFFRERPFGELWRTDGTPEGTQRVAVPEGQGLAGFWPGLEPLGDHVVVSTLDANRQPTLWSVDPTGAWIRCGAVGLGAAILGSQYSGIAAGGQLVFRGFEEEAGLEGVERPWVTDGTPEGTFALTDEVADAEEYSFGEFAVFRGGVYFVWRRELWMSDGTQEGTERVGEFAASDVVATEEHVWLVHDGVLALSDGTAAGTEPFANRLSGELADAFSLDWHGTLYYTGHPFGARLAFRVGNNTLWITDGTAQGTRRLVETADGHPVSVAGFAHSIRERPISGDVFFFRGPVLRDGTEYPAIWSSDGTPEGTAPLFTAPSPWSDNFFQLFRAAGRTFFVADDGDSGHELWITDGTAEGTRLFFELAPGPESGFYAIMEIYDDTPTPPPVGLGSRIIAMGTDGGAAGIEPWAIELEGSLPVPAFLRGDCNDDGAVDISDAIFSLGSLFLGDGDPGCDDACDSNDDGAVDISDAIATLGVLFLGNGIIPLPGMAECGVDPTDDEIGCDIFERCP